MQGVRNDQSSLGKSFFNVCFNLWAEKLRGSEVNAGQVLE
jgi:hypothetical protein